MTVTMDYPRQVALLLPLSGRNAANAGNAIQNGFLGAYFCNRIRARRTRRRIASTTSTAKVACERCLRGRGCQMAPSSSSVPLLRKKRSVNELANDILVPVPVLTLNYICPTNTLAPPGFCSSSLSRRKTKRDRPLPGARACRQVTCALCACTQQ